MIPSKEPLACAIMLTRDRPEMAARAVAAFRAQTYERRLLLVLDTGSAHAHKELPFVSRDPDFPVWLYRSELDTLSIGALRNFAIRAAEDLKEVILVDKEANEVTSHERAQEQILMHWDDDDWSHPNRIAEQVALLQSSGADAVGYREMLFWRTTFHDQAAAMIGAMPAEARQNLPEHLTPKAGQAWLYSHPRANHALGTSLCYWRRTWERKPFPDLPKGPGSSGEDWMWQQGLNVAAESAMRIDGPRMIASIHGGNSSGAYDLERLIAGGSREWKRAPECDDYCEGVMKL